MIVNSIQALKLCTVAGIVLVACNGLTSAQDSAPSATPPDVPSEELPAGSEVLARGPVHEAFAKPVTMDPQAPLLVQAQPPANLQEIPPAEKPAGANIVWVPGYWAWDADRNDFIWVSGCWRNAPPGTYWVPGHWLQISSGWEWIAGFWKPLTAQGPQQMEYLPAPPAAVEVEPPGAPPVADQIWVPGCWYWSSGHYIIRHGYWIAPHAGWVWVPSHFAWTPRGYIFVQGHWDYDMDDRGVLFTPAYFPSAVRLQAGFVFSPSVCLDLGILRLNLFVYPRYNHYCFGDYYDDGYIHAGIYPWFKCQTVHTWYDPLFVYDRWHFSKTEPDWAKKQAREFKTLQANRDLRPARTYVALQQQMARLPAAKRPERPLVQPLKTFAVSQSTTIKFERISTPERQQAAVKSTQIQNLRDQRSHWEAPASTPPARPAPPASQRPPPSESKPVSTPPPRETPVQSKPVSAPPPHETAAKSETRSVKESKPATFTPAPTVRVTRPEQEAVPSPAIMSRPSESRYIEKQAPSHPNQERSGGEPLPGGKSQGKETTR